MNAIQQFSGALLGRLTSKEQPQQISSRIVYLPTVLLLLTLALGFVKTNPATPYFATIGITGFLAAIFFRTTGLACAYGALAFCLIFFYKQIPQGDRLWQVGLCFSWAVDYFVIMLGMEEIEHVQAQQSEVFQKHIEKVQNEIEQLKKESQDERESLQAEINEWKAEAEQRRIEKKQDDKLIALVQSEIELLTGQKEHILMTAFETKKTQVQLKQNMEDLQIQCSKLEEEKAILQQKLIEKPVATVEEIDALLASLQCTEDLHTRARVECQILQAEKEALVRVTDERSKLAAGEIEFLQLKLLELDELYQQKIAELNNEKEEKSAEITQLKTTLSQVEDQGQNALKELRSHLQNEKKLITQEIEDLKDQLKHKDVQYQKHLEELYSQCQSLEEEKRSLCSESDSTNLDPVEVIQLKQELAQSLGLNKQLRNQFEEKSKVLSQTRRELFQIQGQLMALEREQAVHEIDPDRTHEDLLITQIWQLDQEREKLEAEIGDLESLVTRLLT